MDSPMLSGLFIQSLTRRIERWLESGKLDESDLDRALTPNARSVVEGAGVSVEGLPLADAESLVALASDQLGGDTGLVEWAREIVDEWQGDSRVAGILEACLRLQDGPGFVVTQASEQILASPTWLYEGGAELFTVRLRGLEDATPGLTALVGALLCRLAERAGRGFDDVRFEGVDRGELLVFGERAPVDPVDAEGLSRLHRAALVG